MARLQRLILFFAILFSMFLILPAFLNARFPPMPLMDVADVFDLATPWVLLVVYFLLFRCGGAGEPTLRENIVFVVFAAMWAQGQGMHLGANSIGHLLENAQQTDAYALTHFYDEVLGHYLWNAGILGLAALLIVREWRAPLGDTSKSSALVIAASVIYAITTFIVTIEAGTVPMTLPFAAIVAGLFVLRARKLMATRPIFAFYGVAFAIATVMMVGWGLYFRGFPQFSELGIIH